MLRQLLTSSFTAFFFSGGRLILSINNIRNFDNNVLNLNAMILDFQKCYYLLSLLSHYKNTSILNTTIEYVASSKRFEVPLSDTFWHLCMAILFTYLLLFSLSFSFKLEYDFWCSGCFWSFLFLNICLRSQKGLAQIT